MLHWHNKRKILIYPEISTDKIPHPVWLDDESQLSAYPSQLKLIEECGNPANENMLIYGDNLLVLRFLQCDFEKKTNEQKVKCIYIDPPYNTGNILQTYEDKFAPDEWLGLMAMRLRLLKPLLRSDGIIAIQLNDAEYAYLELLMDEIFGANNKLGTIIWRRRQSQANLSKFISIIHDYILVYAKDRNALTWEKIQDSLWLEPTKYGYNQTASNEIAQYFGKKTAFDTPKPELLLYHILEMSTRPGDLVLDCFLGSGTTVSVAHKMQRKWIGIDMGDHIQSLCVKRMKHVLNESSLNDPIGISKLVSWNGGGGFRLYHLELK